MYEAYWGLQEKPFENTPDPRFFYESADVSEIYTRLLYTLKSNHGAALLTGDSGCGKTLLSRALLRELDSDHTEIALLNTPSTTAEEFLREVLYQLGDDQPIEGRSQIIHRIHEILYEYYEAGKGTVVVIEEGQHIEDAAILEEIRLLTNFQLNDAFLVTVLLIGQLPLAERLRKHPPMDQRIATRGWLKPLRIEQTHEYVAHRLGVAGRADQVFTEEAIDLAHDFASGVPRKINNICDIALVVGFSRELDSIDGDWMRRLIQSERGEG